MRIFNSLKQLWSTPWKLISGQRSFDSTIGFINQQLWWAALKREERLHTYDFLYNNMPLVDGAINILVGLGSTTMYADTGDATLDREVNEVLDYLGMDIVNQQIDRMQYNFGFAVSEYVLTPDLGALKRIVVLPSLETRFRVDEQGETTKVIQIPRVRRMDAASPVQANLIEIEPEKCMTFERNKMGINSHYGQALMKTAVVSCDALSKIFDSQLKIYQRFGSPRYTIEVDNNGVDTEERYEDILKAVSLEFAKGENLLGPPGIKATIVGAEGSALRWKDETNLVVSNILAPTGVPSSLLNFNVGGVTESYARQQVLIMLANIRNAQQVKAQQFVRKLCPILSAVYGFPPIKRLRFDPPRLLEEQVEQEARKTQRALDWQDCVDGLISPETFAMRQNVPEAFDIEAVRERVEQARAQMQEPPPETDNGKEGSTKLTDERQSKATGA